GGRRRPARPRGDVLRGRARSRAGDAAFDCARRGGHRAESGCPPARAEPPLGPLLRSRGRGRGEGCLLEHRRAARLRCDLDPVPRARTAGADREGRTLAFGGYRVRDMTQLVQVAVAGSVTEAEELQTLLHAAGIESSVKPGHEHDFEALDDPALRILVAAHHVDDARDAIEALTEPDELIDE